MKTLHTLTVALTQKASIALMFVAGMGLAGCGDSSGPGGVGSDDAATWAIGGLAGAWTCTFTPPPPVTNPPETNPVTLTYDGGANYEWAGGPDWLVSSLGGSLHFWEPDVLSLSGFMSGRLVVRNHNLIDGHIMASNIEIATSCTR